MRVPGRWITGGLAGVVLLLGVFLGLDRHYPLPDPARISSIIILSQDKTPLRAFADQQGVWRYPVTLDEVSPLYLEALLTYEERWFYWHYGVNPLAMLRAVWQWLQHGRAISGGSTLTMQVARILEPHERSVRGKLWQMFRALQLEWHYGKDEILTFYLNLAPFGGPVEGVQAASYAYLRKPASALSHAEAALLAVLPQSPSRLRPDRFPERARTYRDKVLRRLQQLGVWDQAVVDDALIERVLRSGFHQPMVAPLLARRLKQQAQAQGLARLVSSVDSNLQARVENRVQARLFTLPEQASVAVLVMENATGLVRAYVGSADFFSQRRQGQVDMVQALRSPGSTLKPFLYGMALEQGLVHSGSLLPDVPVRLGNYAPENFMRTFQGPVSAEQALQLSLNVPAVGLLQRINPMVFDARLRHVGVELRYPADERPNLSLILGGAGTRLESLVRGFSAFARAGISIRPRFGVADPVVERRLVAPETSWVVGEILRGVAPPGGYSNQALRLAWKTGTSYGFRDAWAIGVNSRYTVGVWTGRPDGTPQPGRYGAMAAGPLLFDIFQALPRAVSHWPRPQGVER
nr:penicillin-binding protein 1C [Thiolinea sp.]